MPKTDLFNHLLLGGTLIVLSLLITWLMLGARILDVPNHRSSHDRPIPSSGGLSIVAAAYVGFVAVYLWQDVFQSAERQILVAGLAAAIVAVAGLLDDLKRLTSFGSKLLAQLLACLVLILFDVVIERMVVPFWGNIELGIWSYPVTLVWVLGLTNIFNFMDGLDGLAAGTAILAATEFGLLTASHGAAYSHVLSYILVVASVGFFVFNFPPARIFMGDVGSQFLGFAFAVLAILASEYDPAKTSILVMPLLFFHFIFDTVLTFFRRLIAGERVTQAHRGHLYQLVNQLGFSHRQVSILQFAMVVIQGFGAWAIVSGAISEPGLVILPFLAIQIVYAVIVLGAARRRGLI